MSGTPPKEGLLRAVPGLQLATPAPEDESLGTLHGHFAVWDEWIEVRSAFEGHFMEKFAPGAFKKTFAENRSRMSCIFRHGLDPQIGQKVLGPIQALSEDERGASYDVPLYDTQYNRELVPGLRDGQYGSSFEFGIIKQDFQQRPQRSEHNPEGIAERVVLEAFVTEFGPCTFPQYKGTTAGIRSVTDDILRERLGAAEAAPGALAEDAQEERPRGRSQVSLAGVSVPTAPNSVSGGGVVYELNTSASSANAPAAPAADLRRYRRSLERAASAPWAIHPEALATILSIIAERAGGYKPSAEEIRERLGGRRAEDGEPASGPIAVLPMFGPVVPRAGLFSDVSGAVSIELWPNAWPSESRRNRRVAKSLERTDAPLLTSTAAISPAPRSSTMSTSR